MTKKAIVLLVSVLVIAGLVLAGCAPDVAPPPEEEEEEAAPEEEEEEVAPAAPEEEVFEWNTQCIWTLESPSGKLYLEFADRVEELTGGRLVMKVHAPGAIVPSLELLDGVGQGMLDAAFSWPGWYAGKDPVFACLGGLPFAFDNDLQLHTWFQQLGGIDMIRDAYTPFNTYIVGMSYYNIESMCFGKEVLTADDLQGIKIRMPGGMLSDIFESFGCSVVLLPGEEVYSALDKGLIDATDWATPADNFAYGFHEIAPYFTWPGFHHLPCNEFMVNQDKWDELPNDIKAILEAAVIEQGFDRATTLGVADFEAVKAMEALGCTALAWDKDEMRKLRNKAIAVWDEWGAKSDAAHEAIESQKAYMKLLGQID